MAKQMTVAQAVKRTYLLATGKRADLPQTETKYLKILDLLNNFQQDWADEPGIDWNSLRTDIVIGTVAAGNTFDLDSDFAKLSQDENDYVRIAHTDGVNETDYTIVPISRLYQQGRITDNPFSRLCAVSGSTLVFAHTFLATDPQFGGTITVPGYAFPDDLVNATDTVQVDNPQWLCYIAAAEFVRTDLTRSDQYGNLVAQARNLMQSMKEQNNAQGEYANTDWSPLGVTW